MIDGCGTESTIGSNEYSLQSALSNFSSQLLLHFECSTSAGDVIVILTLLVQEAGYIRLPGAVNTNRLTSKLSGRPSCCTPPLTISRLVRRTAVRPLGVIRVYYRTRKESKKLTSYESRTPVPVPPPSAYSTVHL